MIRKIVGIITLIGFSLFIGCESAEPIVPITFELQLESGIDSNGYYHVSIDTTRWQTIYRISGNVYRNGSPVNVIKFGWSGSHYWTLGDTLGYIIRRGLTDDLIYVSYDTSYVTGFNGFEVPIVNGASYSREDGEVSTVIAPVKTMRGDTATIFYGYYDNWLYEETYGEFHLIFD